MVIPFRGEKEAIRGWGWWEIHKRRRKQQQFEVILMRMWKFDDGFYVKHFLALSDNKIERKKSSLKSGKISRAFPSMKKILKMKFFDSISLSAQLITQQSLP
jgi:hypothetical protein